MPLVKTRVFPFTPLLRGDVNDEYLLITYRVSDYSQGFLGEIGDVKYRNFETSHSALNELI